MERGIMNTLTLFRWKGLRDIGDGRLDGELCDSRDSTPGMVFKAAFAFA